jgi:hypothetical protein
MGDSISLLLLILEHKKIFTCILILLLIRFVKIILKKENIYEDCLKFENLSPKKQKLFLLTQFNTSINRNEPKEREKCIKKGNFNINF